MATLQLSITSEAHSGITYSLEGSNYIFTFRWNTRAEAWYFDITDENGTVLVSGRRLVVDWPIVGVREAPRVFPGILWAYDTSGQQLDPGVDDLGDRVILLYQEST
jgi:hypothetical protein